MENNEAPSSYTIVEENHVTPADDHDHVTSGPHSLEQIPEDEEVGEPPLSPTQGLPPPSPTPEPTTPPITQQGSYPGQEEGKPYVCTLERKKSSIRRKRVLNAVTADDNMPVQLPLVEYGTQQEVYDVIAERVMHGADVTMSIRTLREKLGMLSAIRDTCSEKMEVRRRKDERIRRRLTMKRGLVMWTYGCLWMCGLVVALKGFYVLAKIYYGLIKDHIHDFRAAHE